MTSDKPPTCLLCGETMREELGMERRHEGLVQRWWTCPRCLHRQTTIDSDCGNNAQRKEGGNASLRDLRPRCR
jgi:transposase-like protein